MISNENIGPEFLIPLVDFERIHKVINTIIRNEGSIPEQSCILFSIYGAEILSEHYGINANVCTGVAAYNIEGNPVFWGKMVSDCLISNKDAYHSWIEAEGFVIDFMAPFLPKLIQMQQEHFCQKINPVQPKMFQRKLLNMCKPTLDLSSKNDFFLIKNNELLERLLDDNSNAGFEYFKKVASDNYQRPPKIMGDKISVEDKNLNVIDVPLVGAKLVGSW